MINKETNNHTRTKKKPMIKSFTETNSAEYLPFPFCLHQILFCFVSRVHAHSCRCMGSIHTLFDWNS